MASTLIKADNAAGLPAAPLRQLDHQYTFPDAPVKRARVRSASVLARDADPTDADRLITPTPASVIRNTRPSLRRQPGPRSTGRARIKDMPAAAAVEPNQHTAASLHNLAS
jgi:hypothetical protein